MKIVDDVELLSSGRGKYDWEEWLDGKTRLITEGEDFHCSLKSIRSLIYTQAARRNKSVTVREHSDNELVFRARPLTDEELARKQEDQAVA